ncbi:MAG TPA: shikimate dehydrogenase [Candidatus Limnocylindrales bacterium]|nr:shikimate dehydrogenase [Candidatus Limnocylindrales bacterium]
MSDVYLLGHPVSHSLSPAVHNAAFAALGLPHRYMLRDVTADALANAVASLRDEHALGANVTVPHKQAAMALVDDLSDEAKTIGAVNTIVRDGSRLAGHNTDAYGFERAMDGVPRPSDVVLLGAGGAARACLVVLLRLGHRVRVANRTRDRAEELVDAIEIDGRRGEVAAWPASPTDVVVNATSLGLHGEDPLQGLPLPRTVVDIVAVAGGTPLVRRARQQRGVRVVDGSVMLLHQAVRAFELWTGAAAPFDVMRAALTRASEAPVA